MTTTFTQPPGAKSRGRTAALPASLTAAGLAVALALLVACFWPGLVKVPYAAGGAVVGALVGLTGVGGGSLMTPLLILLFGVHPASAVGTDLLYASATKAVGSGVHASHGMVDWRMVRRMATGSVPATLATLFAMRALGLQGERSAHALSVALGVVLVATAAALLARDRLARLARARSSRLSDRRTAIATMALGAVLGASITLTSVGAGALGVTALVFLYPRAPVARIVGSDIVHAVPLTLLAGAAHAWMGSVDGPLLLSLLCGSIPGVILGSLLAPRISERVLRPILAGVLALAGLKLVF